MTTTARKFLGVGWKFPIQVTPTGQIARSFFEQRVEESIYLILDTAKGERVMRSDFGCGIHELVCAPNNAMTVARIAQGVRQALTAGEPRIDLLNVGVEA